MYWRRFVTGVEVAIASAAAISKVALSNGHCTKICLIFLRCHWEIKESGKDDAKNKYQKQIHKLVKEVGFLHQRAPKLIVKYKTRSQGGLGWHGAHIFMNWCYGSSKCGTGGKSSHFRPLSSMAWQLEHAHSQWQKNPVFPFDINRIQGAKQHQHPNCEWLPD